MITRKIIAKHDEELSLSLGAFERLEIDVKNNAKVALTILKVDKIKETKILANVAKSAQISIIFADFSKTDFNLNGEIVLHGIKSNCTWRLATLASEKAVKKYDISFAHLAPNTSAKMINYGVAKDEAKIYFEGVNHIKNNAEKSDTFQSAKIITLDEPSFGHASPTLKIDCDDVKAYHAASVGQMSDEHLFYLMSRGLSRIEARKLITIGYLKPISNYFAKNERETIIHAIEEAV